MNVFFVLHTDEKRFVCTTCGKEFRTKIQLKTHKASHTEARIHKCKICPGGKTFNTKAKLNKHMVYHYDPTHPCTQCGRKYYTRCDLRKHEKFHKEPTYECNQCEKKYHSSSHLKRHEKTHLN